VGGTTGAVIASSDGVFFADSHAMFYIVGRD
jgi:hypothetical protein